VLLPTGAGEVRRVERDGIEIYGLGASWYPDGRQVLFNGREAGHRMRTYIQDVDGSKPRPVTPEGITGTLVSPDGKFLVGADEHGSQMVYPIDGGESHRIVGLDEDDQVLQWGTDGQTLYLARANELPVRVYRLHLQTGRKELVKEVSPADPAGILGSIHVSMTPDAGAYILGINRTLSSLFLVEGLK